MTPDIDRPLSWLQQNVPTVVAMVLLLVTGWFLARLTRAGIGRAAAAAGAASDSRWRGFFTAAGTAAFWLIIAFFAFAALQLVRRSDAMGWLDRLGDLLPRLLGGAAILVGGALLSVVVRDIAARSLSQLGVDQARTVARVLQFVVLVTAFVVGVDQLGVQVTFLVTMIAIITGGVVFSVGLAFGLGATSLVRNLIAARDARWHYSPGQRVRVGETEGELLEITPTVFVLATQMGRVTLPARTFHESVVTALDRVAERG
jgi:hypothetical protein